MDDDKRIRRAVAFAAKFAADNPATVEPTDEALERTFAHCAKPAPASLYDDIRAAIPQFRIDA